MSSRLRMILRFKGCGRHGEAGTTQPVSGMAVTGKTFEPATPNQRS